MPAHFIADRTTINATPYYTQHSRTGYNIDQKSGDRRLSVVAPKHWPCTPSPDFGLHKTLLARNGADIMITCFPVRSLGQVGGERQNELQEERLDQHSS